MTSLKNKANFFKNFANKKNQHLIVKKKYPIWCLNNLKWKGDFKITIFFLNLTKVWTITLEKIENKKKII